MKKKTWAGDEAVVQTRCALVRECRNVEGCVLERLEASGDEVVAREVR